MTLICRKRGFSNDFDSFDAALFNTVCRMFCWASENAPSKFNLLSEEDMKTNSKVKALDSQGVCMTSKRWSQEYCGVDRHQLGMSILFLKTGKCCLKAQK